MTNRSSNLLIFAAIVMFITIVYHVWYPGVRLHVDHQFTVVYTALDREFSEPILQQYTDRTGFGIRPKYDVESTKTVGLVEALIAEQARPRCDLFWNNEILNTIRLQRLGLLQTVPSPVAAHYPAQCVDPNGAWYGFAGRLRIIIVNTKLVAESDYPTSVQDLVQPRWQGNCGIAKPLFGTTATHAAVWWSTWGATRSEQFFRDLRSNRVQILGGNKQVATAVASGQIVWGLTDTDDALSQIEAGQPVKIIYPDQGTEQRGLLLIPNTLCLLKSSPNPQAAVALRDWLLTAEVESQLCRGPSGQIPLHSQGQPQARLKALSELKVMTVDWSAAADAWPIAMRQLSELIVE